jgi:hypothetical protein
MDEFLTSPDFDDWYSNAGVIMDVDREEYYTSPENVENYTATRASGGMS